MSQKIDQFFRQIPRAVQKLGFSISDNRELTKQGVDLGDVVAHAGTIY